MLKESSTRRVGNDRFEGICVDLVEELAKELNFNYSFHLNPDDTPGRPDPRTKKWNGMIGELLDGVRRDLSTLFTDVLFVVFWCSLRSFECVLFTLQRFRTV